MKVFDPGHSYELEVYDDPSRTKTIQLDFMKREGENYPGNVGTQPGTNCQELIRVLIDRLLYLNNQIPCKETSDCIQHARMMLLRLEQRAKRVKGKTLELSVLPIHIENYPTCPTCGHILCTEVKA